MSNIGIKFKIMIIVIVGLIGLSITSIYTLSSIVKKRSEAEYSEKIVNVIIKQNDFIHEMQKERGLSSGVLSGGDNVKLIEQRKNVDAMLEKLDEKNEIIPELSSIRSNIDQKNSNSLFFLYRCSHPHPLCYLYHSQGKGDATKGLCRIPFSREER